MATQRLSFPNQIIFQTEKKTGGIEPIISGWWLSPTPLKNMTNRQLGPDGFSNRYMDVRMPLTSPEILLVLSREWMGIGEWESTLAKFYILHVDSSLNWV
jgi:hypothetical protein